MNTPPNTATPAVKPATVTPLRPPGATTSAKSTHDAKTDQLESTLERRWVYQMDAAKKRWPKIDDDEMTRVDGRSHELIGLIHKNYSLSYEEAARQVKRFFDFIAASHQNELFNGKWSNNVAAAHLRWSKISVQDLLHTEGQRSALTNLVSRRYGISVNEARHQVAFFLSRCVL